MRMKLMLLTVSLLALLAGCVQSVGNPMADATNNLINTKADAITTFTAVAQSCQAGALPAADCTKAQDIYSKVPDAYKAADDALILAVQTGDMTQADAPAKTLSELLTDLVKIKGEVKK